MNPQRPVRKPSDAGRGLGMMVIEFFRRWMRKHPGPVATPSLDMDVLWNGAWVPVRATGVVGLRLMVTRKDMMGCGAIGPGQAKDREQFMRVWKHLGGAPLCWADGTPVEDGLV